MIKKLLPVILLLVGSGVGVAAGHFLRPTTPPGASQTAPAHEGQDGEAISQPAAIDQNAKQPHSATGTGAKNGSHAAGEKEYVKLNNQFVVPIVSDDKVAAMVVLALSIEVPAGQSETVFRFEPKLRDSFLQVLFDHANMGGFDGAFTDAQILGQLRNALREVAQRDLGEETVKDVLIVEIARQDY